MALTQRQMTSTDKEIKVIDRRLVPIRYESDPTEWLRKEIPLFDKQPLLCVDSTTYLVILSEAEACAVERCLLEKLHPPFVRRQLNSEPCFAPGLIFGFEDMYRSAENQSRLLETFQKAILDMNDEQDREFVEQEIVKIQRATPN